MKTVPECFLPMQNINSKVVFQKTTYLINATKIRYLIKNINKRIINLLLLEGLYNSFVIIVLIVSELGRIVREHSDSEDQDPSADILYQWNDQLP